MKYTICTAEALRRAHFERRAQRDKGDKGDPWSYVCCSPDGAITGERVSAEDLPESEWTYRFRFNARGRCVIEWRGAAEAAGQAGLGAATEAGTGAGALRREIVVCSVLSAPPATEASEAGPSSGSSADLSDIRAMDLNCYHIGFPLDLGDIEDIVVAPVGGEGAGGGPSRRITTINCPLHNRIFDLQNGDMVRMDYSGGLAAVIADDDDGTAPSLWRVCEGKWRDGVVQRDACRQRVHAVCTGPDGRLVVTDSLLAPANDDMYASDRYNKAASTSVPTA